MRGRNYRVLVFLGVLTAFITIGLTVSAVTGRKAPATGVAFTVGQAQVHDLSFSPDGANLAFQRISRDDANRITARQVAVADVATGHVFLATAGPADANPVWTPDSGTILFNRRTETAVTVDGVDLRDPANTRPVLDRGVNLLGTGAHSWLDSNRLLLVHREADGTRALYTWHRETRKLAAFCAVPEHALQASASTDGGLLAYLAQKGDARTLHVIARDDHAPRYSPRTTAVSAFCWGDDRTLYFVCNKAGANEVELHAITFPTMMDTLVAQYPGTDGTLALGPDGLVAVTAYDTRRKCSRIAIYSTANGQLTATSDARTLGDFAPCWSPDGRYFAYARRENGTGACNIHVIRATELFSRAWAVR